ncbi:MAG: hypothetical protein HOP16_10845 [Acidobacteria bacterium]|nr:hypothetical protein [Acidobacteriota bacterium]
MTASRSLRLLTTALVLWLLAGLAYGSLRLAFGPPPVFVHVRWSPGLDNVSRQRLEQQYHLRPIALEEGSTFSYALTDTRSDNVRDLVLDPAVEDTHNIHRTAFRVGYFAPRLPYTTPYPAVPAVLEIAVRLSFIIGFASLCLAILSRVAPGLQWGPALMATNAFLHPGQALRRTTDAIEAFLSRAIPNASAEAVAVFRLVFGGLLLDLVLRRPVSAAMAVDPSNALSPTHEFMLRPFIAAPWLTDWLPAWILLWGLLFIVGAFARTAFACLTIGVLGWATLYTTATSYHTVCSLLLTLLALQGARWSDAWSVDARRRGDRQRVRATPKQYGYVTWAPALVIGIVFLAAAVAKLRDTGLAWILNGTVKYHFLSDSPSALVDWGLQVGHHPWMAVALSFGAIAIESLVLIGVLASAYRYRLLAGLASLSLLTGFLLFQGLYWPGWWILLIGFLPWHLVRPGTEPASAGPERLQPRLAIAFVVALFAQQIVVSLLRLEASPVFSTYDMYSTTYASPADYEHNAGQVYWIVGLDRTVETRRCRISEPEAVAIERRGPSTESLVRHCFDPSLRVQQVMVEATRVQVDWENWRLLDEPLRTRVTEPFEIEQFR